MARSRSCSATALVVLVATSAGCGSAATHGPGGQAADVVRAFLADCAGAQPERANDLLTPRARAAFADAGSGPAACLRFLGFADPAEHVPAARKAIRRTRVTPVRTAESAQLAIVTLEVPGRPRREVHLERRADEWLLMRPLPADERGKARPERAARNAAASFRTLCVRHEYESAKSLLTDSARRDFERAGAKAGACLKFLGLSKPMEDLSPLEQDRLLGDAEVKDISEVERTSAKVTITAPSQGSADVEAEDQGQLWRLTKPSGSPRDAAKSLLDSCAHEQYQTAAELLAPTARARFREHGGELDACLRLLGFADPVAEEDARWRAVIDQADVSHVKANGKGSATVVIRMPAHDSRRIRAQRDRDGWKLDAAV